MSTRSFTLNTGTQIPAVGFGTAYGVTPGQHAEFKPLAISALKAGYEHIDCAWIYNTESVVGEAIRESGIPRENLFITTKLPWNHTGRVQHFFDDSLKRLGVDYIDLYLMHWPMSIKDYDSSKHMFPVGGWKTLEHPTFNETWAEMEKIFASGKAKAIGVSNFSAKNLEKLLTTAKVVPAVNQLEVHPRHVQQGLVEYCQKKGIHVTAYSPTGYGELKNPVLVELATKYRASPAQIVFAWSNARGISFITKSRNEDRRKEALKLPTLDQADVEKISSLDEKQMAYYSLDAEGTIFGWTLEQLGWEDCKSAEKSFLSEVEKW